jgi:hypothetical protein
MKESLVNRSMIAELLFGDEEYVDQFIDASVESFTEFRDHFKQSMRLRNLEGLKNAGHKIKPVAQIMKLEPIIEMYENSKILLEDNAADLDIAMVIDGMTDYCNNLIQDLKNLK